MPTHTYIYTQAVMYGSVENEQGLRDAAQLQAMTKQKLDGIERTLVETDDVAANTEQELKKQTEQIREVDEQMGVLHGALDRSRQLLNTYVLCLIVWLLLVSRVVHCCLARGPLRYYEEWELNISLKTPSRAPHTLASPLDLTLHARLCYNALSARSQTRSVCSFDRWAFRRANDTEVQAEAAKILQDAELSPLEQQTLFEHQRFDPITRQWKDPFMPRDPGPFVYLDGKPAVESLGASRWKIDFDEPDIDDEGWSYGFDFGNLRSGSRSSKRQWNHFVRRRKWKYQREERSDIVDTMSARYKTGTARPAGLASLAATAEEQNATATTVPGLRVKVASRLPNDPSLTRTLMGRGPRGVDISNSAGGYDSLTAHEKEQLSQVSNVPND
jgi:hypothetical protein